MSAGRERGDELARREWAAFKGHSSQEGGAASECISKAIARMSV